MAKGKVKYRDVVGGTKRKNQKANLRKKKVPIRKKFSLYNSKKNESLKRKVTESVEVQEPKTCKIEYEKESSESDEVDDEMQQLRGSFKLKLNDKRYVSIDSSEDSYSEEDTEDSIGELIEDENEVQQDTSGNGIKDKTQDEEVIETLIDDIENYKENDNDPFVKHLNYDLHASVLNSLQNIPVLYDQTTLEWPKLKRLTVHTPKFSTFENDSKTFSLQEERKFSPPSLPPKLLSLNESNSFIKSQIIPNLQSANYISTENNQLTDFQKELFSIMINYQDLFYSERNFDNAELIRFVYCLHAVNHVLKTRLKIVHHNSRLTKKDDVPEDFRDQGLIRPKILIIVPFKDSAYRIIQMIINILLPDDKGHVMNKKRFLVDYTGNALTMPKKNPKPEDYELTFSGNTNDEFKIGITVTKKSLKLYADFYSSDIIIASPLGLRTIIGAEGETERDYDFLASLELLILDQAELFYMQNWDHLLHVFNHLHLQPKDSHGTDFSRVRTWCLNGWSKYYRQTLIFSSIVLPEINSIFNKKCINHAGRVKISNPFEFGSIRQVIVQLPHVFHKFEPLNSKEINDSRFDFFVNSILTQQRDTLMKQTLIFISSYFDYVRLRNYFKKEELSFVQICEYSKDGKIARARDMFFHGDAHFMLYTERHHFFKRIRIKGIRHLVFYEAPAFPQFYYEICNLMQEGNMNKKVGNMSNMTVSVLYSKYDIHRLAAIVGTDRATKMVQSDRNVHMMVTGGE